jgi:hypothetical protein
VTWVVGVIIIQDDAAAAQLKFIGMMGTDHDPANAPPEH